MKKLVLGFTVLMLCLVVSVQAQKNDHRTKLIKEYYKVLDNGNAAQLNEILSADLKDHDLHDPTANPVENIKGLVGALDAGFKDSHHDLEIVKTIGKDELFVRWKMTGKHVGEFFGNPASGKELVFHGHDFFRFENGKIVEVWHVEDLLGMVMQMKGEH